MAVFIVSVRWTFRMVRSVFHAFNGCRFECLVRVGQFLHRFVADLGNVGETQRANTLSSAELANRARIISQFVRLSLKITFSLGGSFVSFC